MYAAIKSDVIQLHNLMNPCHVSSYIPYRIFFFFCKKPPMKALIKERRNILRLLLDVCSITIFYSFRKWNQSISEKGECMVMCGGNCYLILYKKFKMLILQLYSQGYIILANAFTSFEQKRDCSITEIFILVLSFSRCKFYNVSIVSPKL